MKIFKLFLTANLFLMSMLISNDLFGNPNTLWEVRPMATEKSFLLIVDGEGPGNITVKIYDTDKRLIFSKGMEPDKATVKKFNLNSLELGNYFLYVEDEMKLTVHPLEIKSTGLEIDKKQREIFYHPVVEYDREDGFINVNWFMHQRGDYKMTLENKSLETVFEDKISNGLVIHRYYDARKLIPGTYYMTFSNGTQSHVKTIKVR